MELLLGWLFMWAVLACIPAAIAQGKGRGFGGWWFYGFLLFPIALIHSLVMAPSAAGLERRAMESGLMRKCPYCAEAIKKEARVCRWCGRDVPALGVKPAEVVPGGA